MEKKFYEIPSMEVLDMNVEGFFCASTNVPDIGTGDTEEFPEE